MTAVAAYRQLFTISVRDVEELVGLFRSRGLRITPQRRQIFGALVANASHPTAEALWAAVREEHPGISLKTVYETLHELVDVGAIQRLHAEPGASRFDVNVSAHNHLICRACGRMVDVDAAVDAPSSMAAAVDAGHEIEEAEVIYWGRCRECVAAASASSAEQPRSKAASHRKKAAREENDRRV